MSEGPPISLPAEPTWNTQALESVLGPAAPITEGVFGRGQLFRVPEGGQHTFAIYPDSRVARLAAHAVEMTLFDLAPPIVSECQVIFQDEQPAGARHLSVTRTGEIAVLFAPLSETQPSDRRVNDDESGYVGSTTCLTTPPAEEDGFDDREYARLYRETFGGECGTS